MAPLVAALERAGVEVWRDEARIDEGASIQAAVLEALRHSHVLLAWYSADYPESRMCIWEQTLAWIAGDFAGAPHARALVLVPPELGNKVDHVVGLAKDHKVWRVPAADSEELARVAQSLAEHILGLEDRELGALAPLGVETSWHLGPRRHPSERFTGRAKDLWAVHTGLSASRLVAVTGRVAPGTAQVRGLGGVGKTLLAVEYATRFGAAFPGGVFWVDAAGRTPEGVFGDVALELGIPPAAPDTRARVKAALTDRGAYLWVTDNLPLGLDQREVEAWCAPTPNGRTLITTRSRTWGALGAVLDLDVLEPAEALELLTKRRSPSTGDRDAARALAAAVGHHPLALDLLGALVARSPAEAPYARWLERVRDPSRDTLELAADLKEELPTGAEKSVATVLRASLDGLSADAKDLLRLTATLADAPIPASLALRVFETLGAESERAAEDRWALGLEDAGARSLVELDAKGAPAYAVHALVRRLFTFDPAEAPRLAELRNAALAALCELFCDPGDIRTHDSLLGALPHAEYVAEALATRNEAGLAALLGIFYKTRGNYPSARTHEERALEAMTRILGEEHPDTLGTLQNLAVTLKNQGDLAGARRAEERALKTQTRILGEEHPNTLMTLQNLAVTLDAQGDLGGARRTLEHVLKAQTRIFGEEHPGTLMTLQNLAATLESQGDFAGARRTFERALEARTRILGEEHPGTLGTLQNLAGILHAQGDFAGARRTYERALKARTRILGEEHPDTLTTLQNLAGTLFAQGDLAAARRLYEMALEARTRILGEEHPETLTTLQNLAGTLFAQGDHAAARRTYERALSAHARILGEEHPDTLMMLQNLAGTLQAQGDLTGARRTLEAALEARTRILGEEHPDTLMTLQNLAVILKRQGDLAGARRIYERALKARTLVLGEEHPDTATTRFNLVLTLLQVAPSAAADHIAVLERLSRRPRESLSAVELQILGGLPGLRSKSPNRHRLRARDKAGALALGAALAVAWLIYRLLS